MTKDEAKDEASDVTPDALPVRSVERHCDRGNCADCDKQYATPELGGAATCTLWSDSYACTVIKISPNGKTAWLRRDKAKLMNGHNSEAADKLQFSPGGFVGHTSGAQRYQYEPDADGQVIKVSRRVLRTTRTDGFHEDEVVWKQVGQSTRSPGATAYFGARHEHYDFNF